MISTNIALKHLLKLSEVKNTEVVPLEECSNRVLASNLIASHNQPPFDCSAINWAIAAQVNANRNAHSWQNKSYCRFIANHVTVCFVVKFHSHSRISYSSVLALKVYLQACYVIRSRSTCAQWRCASRSFPNKSLLPPSSFPGDR